eukprot:242118_1
MAFERWAVYTAGKAQQKVNIRQFGQYKSVSGRKNFFDRAIIRASGGRGGDGCISFNGRGPYLKIPSGGDGGKGGDVLIMCDKRTRSLAMSQYHYIGGVGGRGGPDGCKGRRGSPTIVRVPCGTDVKSVSSCGSESRLGFDLCEDGGSVMVARGGHPGLGNHVFSGSRQHKGMGPRKLPGHEGESITLSLELKTIADVGFIGYPNAGKSSLLGVLSLAQPKVAPYPFTTLEPHVGHIQFEDDAYISVADIPGLIEGAHKNRGLGHKFLRHVERTKVIAYIVDAAGSDGRDPCEDLLALQNELFLYNESLAKRPAAVLVNKMDLPGAEDNLLKIKDGSLMATYPVSAQAQMGLAEAASALRSLVQIAHRDSGTHGGDQPTNRFSVM